MGMRVCSCLNVRHPEIVSELVARTHNHSSPSVSSTVLSTRWPALTAHVGLLSLSWFLVSQHTGFALNLGSPFSCPDSTISHMRVLDANA